MNEIEGQKDYHMIRPMMAKDTDCVLEMMQVFYASPAVFTNGSDNIFLSDIAACVGDSPYLEGYIFEEGMEILGYAMIAKSFSTEFGKPCMWIEDLYIREAYRGTGLGSKFLDYRNSLYCAGASCTDFRYRPVHRSFRASQKRLSESADRYCAG